MLGKEKCKALKEIRRRIAEENDIEYIVSECTYQGECKGTCPRCEAELTYLEKELARKKTLGRVAIVAGIAAGAWGGLALAKEALSDYIEENMLSGAVNPDAFDDME